MHRRNFEKKNQIILIYFWIDNNGKFYASLELHLQNKNYFWKYNKTAFN